MQIQSHQLPEFSHGTRRTLQSLHFGPVDSGRRAYLQASLHADELPGMLTLHHLRRLLEAAEAAGRLQGEIVLVPFANPIGLAQGLLHQTMGRFELSAAANFNRNFPDLLELAGDDLIARLGPSESDNAAILRAAWRDGLATLRPATEVEALRALLMRLACDAEVVLDLHCDEEAPLHLYTETSYWPKTEPLARYLGALVTLTAEDSGGQSFDEALSTPWTRLRARLAEEGRHDRPVPLGCLAVTVELRGQDDVDHELAAGDAQALFDFLQHGGWIAGVPPSQPALLNGPTPLAGSDAARAPHAGVIAHLKPLGVRVEQGEVVAEVIDVNHDRVSPVVAGVSGILYGRVKRRYVHAGMEVCKVAGSVAHRTGYLLSP